MIAKPVTYASSPRDPLPPGRSFGATMVPDYDLLEMLVTTSPTLTSVEALIDETEPTTHSLGGAAEAFTPCHRDTRWASCASCGTARRVLGVQRPLS